MVHVQVKNPQIRFARVKQRGKTKDPQSYEDFLAQEETERDMFQLEEAIRRADVTMSNARSLDEFHQEIDQLIAQHQFFRGLDCQS